MNTKQPFSLGRALTWLVLIGVIVAGAWLVAQSWPRGAALDTAMQPMIEGKQTEQALVARAILQNYHETRKNASRWSGAYWGFTFTAAILSALAALVLKLESPLFKNDAMKKDIAAAASVAAALLVTLSTSGDFQRKWTANRIAAAELEHLGYTFLEKNGADARSYLARIGQILEQRHLSIVGTSSTAQDSKAAGGS
ncbi:MAG: DUF4231 domain-containing protein [Gammaproteobacteria bacterium]|nr:DUF4231 domain-containing protein [Gammaproteobacteria bacterium]